MSSEAEQVARTWFREVWDEGREDAIDRLMAPEGVVHGLPGGTLIGPAGFKPFYQMFRGAIGGITVEVVRTVTQGDTIAAHCHVKGTHSGAGLGGPPSDRAVDFWGIAIVRIEDGRVVEGWNCFDLLTMYQQIGWVGAPPAP